MEYPVGVAVSAQTRNHDDLKYDRDLYYVNPWAVIDTSVKIGRGTRIWQFASVIRGTVLGEDCNVAHGACLDGPVFGDRCIICHNVAMGPGFKIGNDVFVGPGVVFCNDAWPTTSKEGWSLAAFQKGDNTILVGDGSSIGANATVLPGVKIGKNCMIAAGAVVNRDVPDFGLFCRDGSIRDKPIIRERMRLLP